MIESTFVNNVLDLVLLVMVVLLIPCAWRVIIGPSPADRLQAIDTITNLLIGIIVLLALLQDTPILVDMGTALAAFAFIATLAISRYLTEGRMF
ncbi:MAG: monovalent cation/H+ antiporter complex subunit F [Chloroflexota bacterium]